MLCRQVRALVAVVALLFAGALNAGALNGDIAVHDPSTIMKCGGKFWNYATGSGGQVRYSADLLTWTRGPKVFNQLPAWVAAAVPAKHDQDIWAPDVLFMNNQYYLYYSVSTFGSDVSAIGLATSPTLDFLDSKYKWTDQGIVVQSTGGQGYNTIDPSLLTDYAGNLWLSFGSYWSGIKLMQLDKTTGKPSANAQMISLASRPNFPYAIEASCLYKHNNYYYLFVNYDSCCQGITTAYNIRVGRSASITGPYIDKNGVRMTSGGGSLFLGTYDQPFKPTRPTAGSHPPPPAPNLTPTTINFQIGPGHAAFFTNNGTEYYTNDFYDGNNGGRQSLHIAKLAWDATDWPVSGTEAASAYPFRADARDAFGRYDGVLSGGASFVKDAQRGRVLSLNGQGQYAELPTPLTHCSEFTFAAWVKWNGGADWQRIFDFGVDANAYMYLTARSGATQKMHFGMKTAGAGEIGIDTMAALPVGVWTHVAVTLSSNVGRIYVNGVLAGMTDKLTTPPHLLRTTHNYIGKSQFPDPTFNGLLSSVKIINRALSASEILKTGAESAVNFDIPASVGLTDDSYSGVFFNPVGNTLTAFGVLGNAFAGDGLTASLETAYPALDTTQSYSVAAWVRLNATSGWQTFIGQDGANVSAFYLQKRAFDDRFAFVAYAEDRVGGASSSAAAPNIVVNPNVWYHLVGVYDAAPGANAVRLYVNGQRQSSAPFASGWASVGRTTIGRARFNAAPVDFVNGAIDSVRLYRRALADADALALFNAGN